MAVKSETKVGLVVALVFFILTTIALGVTTYAGFSGQEEPREEAKKAKASEKDEKEQREYWQFQALYLRDLTGKLANPDDRKTLADLRRRYDQGQLGTKNKDREEVRKNIVEAFDKSPGWNAQDQQARSDFSKELARANDELQKVRTQLDQTRNDLEKANDEIGKKDRDLRRAENKFKDDLNKLAESYNEAAKKHRADLTEAQNLTRERQQIITDLQAQKATLEEDHAKALALKDKEMNNLRRQLEKAQGELARIEAQSVQKVLDYDYPKGKIVSLDRFGQTAFVQFPNSDGLKPGMTFSVFGAGPGGRSNDIYKGSVEVVRVERSISQAKITEVRDPNRNPIVPGDLLFNPAWIPGLKQHVAIAGIVDMKGDGSDYTNDFMRTLERQGIVIDAYLDLKKKKIEGRGVSRQTDFLILGEPPDIGSGIISADDPRAKERENLLKLWNQMQEEAAKNGVVILPVRKFMVQAGIRPPRGTSYERPIDYTRERQAPKDAPKPPDKGPDMEAKDKNGKN
jgi:hypothetical protein